MDWQECDKKRMIKEAKTDMNKMKSLVMVAEEKLKAVGILPLNLYYGKLSLLYDALRSYLEYIALKSGFKIYNHECYTSFLKEKLKEYYLADSFDKFRRVRNGINYYGKTVNQEEAKEILADMQLFIKQIKKKYIDN